MIQKIIIISIIAVIVPAGILFSWKHIHRIFLFLKYTFFITHTLKVIDKSAETVAMRDIQRWIHVYSRRWYSRKMVYLWIKANRDGKLKYEIDIDRIEAKKMWDDTNMKVVNPDLLGEYLIVFRDDWVERKYSYEYHVGGTYNQIGTVFKVEHISEAYQHVNNYHITQCKFATDDEIMNHLLMEFEKEAIYRCEHHNIIPVYLKNKK